MRIIKKIPPKNQVWVVKCQNCGTILQYDKSDITHDQREGSYIQCPECAKYINHSNGVDLELLKELKNYPL